MDTTTLSMQFSAGHGIGLRNLANISHEQSLMRPEPGGNCLNWVLGHLVSSRSAMLEVLGGQRVLDRESCQAYERGSSPLADDQALPFPKLLELFTGSQGPLLAALAALPPERLAEPAPFSPGGRDDETIGSLLTLFAFHEAYHVGQTGLLRRLAGFEGAIA